VLEVGDPVELYLDYGSHSQWYRGRVGRTDVSGRVKFWMDGYTEGGREISAWQEVLSYELCGRVCVKTHPCPLACGFRGQEDALRSHRAACIGPAQSVSPPASGSDGAPRAGSPGSPGARAAVGARGLLESLYPGVSVPSIAAQRAERSAEKRAAQLHLLFGTSSESESESSSLSGPLSADAVSGHRSGVGSMGGKVSCFSDSGEDGSAEESWDESSSSPQAGGSAKVLGLRLGHLRNAYGRRRKRRGTSAALAIGAAHPPTLRALPHTDRITPSPGGKARADFAPDEYLIWEIFSGTKAFAISANGMYRTFCLTVDNDEAFTPDVVANFGTWDWPAFLLEHYQFIGKDGLMVWLPLHIHFR
jgi:hypothetical protein